MNPQAGTPVSMEALMVAISLTTLVLLFFLVALFYMLHKALASVAEGMQRSNQALLPLLGEVRLLTMNLTHASESLKGGMDSFGRFSGALGEIGDDLDAGRRTVKLGVGLLKHFAEPLLGKFKRSR